jgi:poly(3-hydroxybutyrate) depolymerase
MRQDRIYFPNWTSATTDTIISSGEKREYLLYVPKSYDRAKPTPLVINLHTSMSWPSSSMAISQWNQVADEQGFIVAYPEGTGCGPKSWEMTGRETPARMPDAIFIAELIDKLEVLQHRQDANLRKRDVERRRHGVRSVLHAVRSDRGSGNGFGWA